jgi:hypothetical protein
MRTDGQSYLDLFAGLPVGQFERRFARILNRLGLGAALRGEELKLLYDAAYWAALCNIAMNGLGGCDGEIKPENEVNRLRLESSFMVARALFYATCGWQHLSDESKGSVELIFLRVRVNDENLGW